MKCAKLLHEPFSDTYVVDGAVDNWIFSKTKTKTKTKQKTL